MSDNNEAAQHTNLLKRKDAEIEKLSGSTISCVDCVNGGGLAVCFGSYEDSPIKPSCDECCGHGNEDGWCESLDDVDWSRWQAALDHDAYQDAQIHRLQTERNDLLLRVKDLEDAAIEKVLDEAARVAGLPRP